MMCVEKWKKMRSGVVSCEVFGVVYGVVYGVVGSANWKACVVKHFLPMVNELVWFASTVSTIFAALKP